MIDDGNIIVCENHVFDSMLQVEHHSLHSSIIGEHTEFTSPSRFSLTLIIAVVVFVIKVLVLSPSIAVSLGADEQESHPTSPSSDSLCA
jgi:formate hydrogenlyase subunit 4